MTWVTLMVHPVLDACKHVPVELQVVVSNSRVVEHTAYVVHDLVFGHVRVVPGIDDAWCDVLQDHRSELAGRLVEDIREMIFA